MQLLGSSKKMLIKIKMEKLCHNWKLLSCFSALNNNYQQASKVLFTFVPNK